MKNLAKTTLYTATLSLTCLICLLLCGKAVAQEAKYKYHPVYIYNITKYVLWPESKKSGDFVIGMLGNSPLGKELDLMARSKTIGGQKLTIKRFTSIESATYCHILFVPADYEESFEQIVQKFKGESTMLITEKKGMIAKGSALNFVMLEDKLKFEINEKATAAAGLKVSKELSDLAIKN